MSAAPVEARFTIIEPGVYTIPEDAYHADPVPGRSLSSSGAKKLLPPSCPAKFKYDRDHGQAPKQAFDFGHAAHAKVLGVGAPVVIVQKTAKDGTKSDADDYRTKSAQEHCDEIRASGATPLLASEKAQVDGMAAALAEHPVASALFDPEHGTPEQSLFWDDLRFDVMRRCRLDWLPVPRNGRLILADYKSTVSAEPRSFAKSMANYGYAMQAGWNLDLAIALGLGDESSAFLFVAQEKTPPYVVSVFEPDSDALRLGRRRNDQALEVYAECTAHDHWPGYVEDVALLSLPAWAAYEFGDVA
jgi:hypothetical protein